MARTAPLAVAALLGLLVAGCYGSVGQAGFSLPAASDGVQTVSDAADALDGHRSSASASAKSAIAVTDALGSFIRDLSADQRALAGSPFAGGSSRIHVLRQYETQRAGKQVVSGSEFLIGPGSRTREYCQNSAGYSVNGIPSLDATFGWESGAYNGGTRTTDGRGSSTWDADASGAVVQGSIGDLTIAHNALNSDCPMNSAAFVLKGGVSENAFSIPISIAFRNGRLSNVRVAGAKFANGENLQVTTRSDARQIEVDGIIIDQRTQLATFRANGSGDGTLTITSTGAQYVVADWIVVGT